jgi:type I restriction enzyme M protein
MLEEDGLKFAGLDENSKEGAKVIEAVKEATVKELGYFLKPSELFHAIAMKGNNQAYKGHNFILPDLTISIFHVMLIPLKPKSPLIWMLSPRN